MQITDYILITYYLIICDTDDSGNVWYEVGTLMVINFYYDNNNLFLVTIAQFYSEVSESKKEGKVEGEEEEEE